MANSLEWPDLAFVPPRAWGKGRDGKAVKIVVVHYTAGAERNTSAEDGAAYDARRTDGVSTHYFHDPNSTVQCVYTKDRANAAFHKGNRLGIQHELCGTVQTRAQWLDEASRGVLDRAAKQIARDCVKYKLPVRRLSVAETRACWYNPSSTPGGIVGHVDVTYAFPEDGGDHIDPGTEFPWDVLLERVNFYVSGEDMSLLPDERAALMAMHKAVRHMDGRIEAMAAGRDVVADNPVFLGVGTPVWIVPTLKDVQTKVTNITITDEQCLIIAERIAELLPDFGTMTPEEMEAACTRAIAYVLKVGTDIIDVTTPETEDEEDSE